MKDFEKRNGAANSELRAIHIRKVYRDRATVVRAVLAGAGPPTCGPIAHIQAPPSEREKPLTWRESDPDPQYAAPWADPLAVKPKWYSDNRVRQWNTAAISGDYRSHTERWRQDDGHRRQCCVNRIPQWLLWHDGSYAALNGRDQRWY